MTYQVVTPPYAYARAEYVIDRDLPDEERCPSTTLARQQRCDLELGHDGCHIHVEDNGTVGWLNDAS